MNEAQELSAVIARLIQDAQSFEDIDTRSDLFDRYMGEPYGDEVDGRSSFISSDVADAVEALLPDIMDVFTSSEDIVTFEPVGPEDEAAARQETDVVNHVFWRLCDGYETLYTWIKDALIHQNAYVRFGWVEKERVTIEEYEDLTPEELVEVLAELDGEYEILEKTGFSITPEGLMPEIDPQSGMPVPIGVKIRCTKTEKRCEIRPIPQEEFILTQRWHKLTFDGAPCVGHRREMEAGELIAMGFDPESVASVRDSYLYEEQKSDRFDTRDYFASDGYEGDDSTRRCLVYEAYVRADWDDDGKAELLKVWAGGDGGQILKWADGRDAIEEVSHVPFAAITPYIVPHRHVGRSVAEQVDDIQKVKTVLLRNTLDNVYSVQWARPVFNPDETGDETYTDLMNPSHGAPVRSRGPIEWMRPPAIIDTTLPLLQQFDDLKEARVGATRYNQGLDAESLNKTATGIQAIMNASQKKTKLIARTLAETGIREMFRGIHRDLRSGPIKQLAVKLRGQWVQTNPRAWRDRSEVTVNVGMGSGDRDAKRSAYMLMAQLIEKLMMDPELRQAGLVGYPQIRAVAERTMETFGIESIDEFLPPMPDMPPQEDGPDPREEAMQAQMQLAQADMQLRQMEAQQRAMDAEAKRAHEAQKLNLEREIKMAELEIRRQEMETRSAKAASDIQTDDERVELQRLQALREDDFKRDKLEADTATGFMREARGMVRSRPPAAATYDR